MALSNQRQLVGDDLEMPVGHKDNARVYGQKDTVEKAVEVLPE